MLSVVMLNVVMLNVVMLNVVMLNVIYPECHFSAIKLSCVYVLRVVYTCVLLLY